MAHEAGVALGGAQNERPGQRLEMADARADMVEFMRDPPQHVAHRRVQRAIRLLRLLSLGHRRLGRGRLGHGRRPAASGTGDVGTREDSIARGPLWLRASGKTGKLSS